jgi:hypothetical protein
MQNADNWRKEAVEETLAGTFKALSDEGACRKPPVMS